MHGSAANCLMSSSGDDPDRTREPFLRYSRYLQNTFGEPVQKVCITLDGTCPNRDGSKGRRGCTYCNPASISTTHAFAPVSVQLENGIRFYKSRSKARKYLAYFQSYTNSYGDLEQFIPLYREALNYDGVCGLIIGTRPDCITPAFVSYLSGLSQDWYVSVELGIESTEDSTLERVNRCHTFADTVNAVTMLAGRNIHIGGHLILGLPGESQADQIRHAGRLSVLPLDSLKLHHLQVLRHTRLFADYKRAPFALPDVSSYLDTVIAFLERSRTSLVFQRFLAEAPKHLLIAPDWSGIRNNEFTRILSDEMTRRKTYQGRLSLGTNDSIG